MSPALPRALHRTVRLSASGDASPELAWQRYERFDLWPTWSPQIRGVQVDAELLAAGLRGTVVGPLGFRVEFHVDAVDAAARTWSWTVRPAWPLAVVELSLVHAVTGLPGGRSTTTLASTGPAPVVLAYAPLALIALRRLVSAS
ncbi:MAG TPA: SRPBCC family protein [Actinomycetales bacterium]